LELNYTTMKRLLFALLVIAIQPALYGQDMDVYKRDLNDHFKLPQLPDSMTYEEFKTLSTNLRLIDAAEAMIVPGLIHFKVKDKVTGYSLVGARLLGYVGVIYVNINNKDLLGDLFNYEVLNSDESKSDYYIALGSIGLIAGSYFYDWIHARYLLDKKQQKIRFKYAVKIRPEMVNYHTNVIKSYPELSLRILF